MHIRRMKAAGAISVKSYNQQRRDTRQMILKAAREQGLMVVPEGGSLLYQNLTQITDGHTGIEHSLPVPKLYRDVVTLFSKTKVGYTPTLIVAYGGLMGENYWYQHDDVWRNPRLQAFTPRDTLVERSRRRPMAAEDDFNHVLIARGAKALKDAGTSVQLGAHGQLQGLGAHWELWMLAQGGMTPLEALDSATISGARYLGMDKDLGSLETGKLADLVVLDKNPLEDIRNSDSVRFVMLNGRLYDAATLDQIAPDARKRPPFWWQRPVDAPAAAPQPALACVCGRSSRRPAPGRADRASARRRARPRRGRPAALAVRIRKPALAGGAVHVERRQQRLDARLPPARALEGLRATGTAGVAKPLVRRPGACRPRGEASRPAAASGREGRPRPIELAEQRIERSGTRRRAPGSRRWRAARARRRARGGRRPSRARHGGDRPAAVARRL